MTTPDEPRTWLTRASKGDPEAINRLFDCLYAELHKAAERLMRAEQAGHTLRATALVHEAYLRLADAPDIQYADRAHFNAIAARAMRQVLIDHARSKKRQKRGGSWRKISLDVALLEEPNQEADMMDLLDAIERLRELDERAAQLAELRLLGGLTIDEAALALDVSRRTVERDWAIARAWLHRELARSD